MKAALKEEYFVSGNKSERQHQNIQMNNPQNEKNYILCHVRRVIGKKDEEEIIDDDMVCNEQLINGTQRPSEMHKEQSRFSNNTHSQNQKKIQMKSKSDVYNN